MGVRQECWVTAVLDTSQCAMALVLGKSLKRVLTSRSLVVLVSSTIPLELRELLRKEFDHCVILEKPLGKAAGMSDLLYAKIYSWSMTNWDKIVFLEPNCLVVKNCDELFKLKQFCPNNIDELSMFVTEPTMKLYEKWIKTGCTKNDISNMKVLDEKFNVNVNLEKSALIKNLDEISIVRFIEVQPLEILNKNKKEKITGCLEMTLFELWEDYWNQGVANLLSRVKQLDLPELQNHLRKWKNETPNQEYPVDCYKNSVAIVGISCRFPGANNLDEFWKLLIQGKDEIRSVPEGRWVPEKCPDVFEDSKHILAGFLKCKIDEFDGKFFGMSPAELAFIDPQQRLALQVTWEALEEAGINPLSLKDTYTGVFGGAWRHDYEDMLANAGYSESEVIRNYLGNSFGAITARISHCLGLTGPSIGTDSGCSSSIVAVDLACKSLLRHETDLSLACGVNLLVRPFTGKSMSTVIARDGHCKTFDASADGFARAEGCAVLVLKRYADAVRDGDRVYALIRGSAVVQEGASRSLGTPTKYCEALAMQMALDDAGVKAKDVSFVETHGTGTPVGDPLEVAAMAEVYSKGREEQLIIGSVKTNIGHTESCSGIAGIIKVVLAMQNEMIPQHLNFETLNPLIDLDAIPAAIPLKPTEWKKTAKPRIAGISSFGITGTDAHAIIEETPDLKIPRILVKPNSPRPTHILKLSAKTPEALDENMKQFKSFIEKSNDLDFKDIAYAANVGRGDFLFRAAIVGSNNTQILANMKNWIKKQAPEETPKICFLFTGQGSQYPGMGKHLYEHSPTFQMYFDQCDSILSRNYGISIKEALWGKNGSNLSRTIYSQTSIFCIEVCLLKLWESWGIKPDYVLGHSLGEFAAAVGAGIMKFEDALKLVAERSKLIDALPGGKMLVLKQSFEKTEMLLQECFKGTEKWLDYAAVNSPDQTVLAGSEENALHFATFCKTNGVKIHILEATHAFHSRHMDPILDEYRKVASTVKYLKPKCIFVSGMEGRIIEEGSSVSADYWVRHTRDRVRFSKASMAVMELGCSVFLELGPQPVLSALTMINSDEVKGIDSVTCLPSIRRQDEDWPTILNTLGILYVNGINVHWNRFDQFSDIKKVTVPFYPFQNKVHWFEIADRGPGQIHPLVGKPVSNATELKLYENRLDLENVQFLKDHAIGNRIIFPGAGFMEMCLVAAHAAIQCTETGYFHPTAPVTLANFAIESPLGLVDNEVTQIQTVVSSEDSGDTKVIIYSKLVLDKETHKWIRHASALFSPYANLTKEEEISGDETLANIQTRCSEEVPLNETYGKLAEFGLKFGPTFQTLQSMWKGENEVYFEVGVTDRPEKYICHPVISDAMFQAIMIAMNPSANNLHVPVSVTKFIWFAKIETEKCFIHCRTNSGEAVAVLYDNNGQLLAQMVGATLVETTVNTIMSTLEAQRISLPSMYEDVWRAQLGPKERRVDLSKDFTQSIYEPEYIEEITSRYNGISEKDRVFTDKSNALYSLYMLKGLYDLGWVATVGTTYSLKEMVNSFKVVKELEGFCRYIFMELTNDGYFEILNSDREAMSFRVVKAPPTYDEILSLAEALYKEVHPMSSGEVEYVSSTGRQLAVFLTGKESALPLLFPEEPSAVSAEAYYMDSRVGQAIHALGNDTHSYFFNHCSSALNGTKNIIRLLEVGAGTGSYTKNVLPFLMKNPSSYEYTFTDLSPIFFIKGKQIFENTKIQVLYRIFNIEEDPVNQGFLPAHYDIIIANNVIHATKSISETCGNLRNLLRDNGALFVTESVKPARNTNLTFGLLDAYWRFEDYELRNYNCEISMDKWTSVLKNNHFDKIACYPAFESHVASIVAKAQPSCKYSPLKTKVISSKKAVWIIFSEESETSTYFQTRLEELGNQVVIVTRSTSQFTKSDEFTYSIRPQEETDMENLFNSVMNNSTIRGVVFLWGLNYKESEYSPLVKPFLALCKIMMPLDHPKLFVVTKGVPNIGNSNINSPMSSPLWAMTKCFQNEKPEAICRCVDLDDSGYLAIDQLEEALAEFFTDDQEIYVAYRDNQRNLCRFLPWKLQNNALSFPKSERFRLVLPPSNAINDLRFGVMEKAALKDGEVEVQVKAYALNFRDVFAILKPSAEFEKFNTVGIDYAGVVVGLGPNVSTYKLGDSVFGCNLEGDSLPSHIVTPEDTVMRIPERMTYTEAATLPAVASTAYLSLVQVANLSSEDTILIHTGSGGVGLVAIQIAQSVGATIVTTAGSRRKRTFLKNLGIKHVFNSRNTNFENEIRTALNGNGVDVVLNSLTSEGFKEASLSVCNKGARFIEMSKLNTWTPEEVKVMRPDVNYQIVDLSASTHEQMRELMKNVASSLDSSISPIPYVRFDVSEIREALNYMQKAKHIGKIVCVMPDITKTSSDQTIPMFNDRSTYLITGGLGGIGFEVAKWMAQSGAKNIALVGRNPPKHKISEEIHRINSIGKNILTLQYDVGNVEQCQKLLKMLKSEELDLPPLRGIMHAAGVLSDAMYANQTWEKYERTFNPKVNGGWNLHQFTLDYPLEHFVMFSSAVVCMGSLGQSNHASANFFLDSLAFYRNSIGLPATTVNWGQWGQVGVAANMEVIGIRPFTTLQGILALEKIMKSQKLSASVCEADFGLVKQIFPATRQYLEELKLNNVHQVKEFVINKEQFWTEFDAVSDDTERQEKVKILVRSMIRQILKLDKDEPMNDDENFQDLGMDSLMMIEMKNVIQSTLGKRATVTVTSVKDCHTVNQLAAKLYQLISGETEEAAPTREEIAQLIQEDSQLPIHIQPLSGHSCKLSEIKTVLITGTTGTLGSYILRDISQRNQISKIYCLLKSDKTSTALQRLEKVLLKKNLLAETQMGKIECIEGSISKAKFGLSEEIYSKLATTVEAVLHLAGNGALMDVYRKVDKSEDDVRTVNVKGTLNVLEFASSMKTKMVFHPSSSIVNLKLDKDTTLSENWPSPQDYEELPDKALPISKLVSDRLMAQAAERGLPVKVFRFPTLGGDSRTGANVNLENNQLMLRILGYIQIGHMPALPFPILILPVDICSEFSLRLFFDDKVPTDIYNVYNPYTYNETEIGVMATELGFTQIQALDMKEFEEKLVEKERTPLTEALQQMFGNKYAKHRFSNDIPSILTAWTKNPRKAFLSKKLATFLPEEYPMKLEHTLSTLKRDLAFAKTSGGLKQYGI